MPEVTDAERVSEGGVASPIDARALLAEWANEQDDWVRTAVAQVFLSSQELSDAELGNIFTRFMVEKGFQSRPDDFQLTPKLELSEGAAATEDVLELNKLEDVAGVNALTDGQILEFDPNLTILFGENGSGKTGYSRVLKRVAAVRTAEAILPNALSGEPTSSPSASIQYSLNGEMVTLSWNNEAGIAPLTRMSVFDAPAVMLHVDNELKYVFTPREIALFSYVSAAISHVQYQAEAEAKSLRPSNNPFTVHFKRGTSVYAKVETLGATTDLAELFSLKDDSKEGRAAHDKLASEVAALKAGSVESRHSAVKDELQRVKSLLSAASALARFDSAAYVANRVAVERLNREYRSVRSELFAEGELAGPPDDQWGAFISEGDRYRLQLARQDYPGPGDECLYCRQVLSEDAVALIRKYRTYLDDKLAQDLAEAQTALAASRLMLPNLSVDVLKEQARYVEDQLPAPRYAAGLSKLVSDLEQTRVSSEAGSPLDGIDLAVAHAAKLQLALEAGEADLDAALADLDAQLQDRQQVLITKEHELAELGARIALASHWPAITEYVEKAKRASQLEVFTKNKIPAVLRSLTRVSKQASEEVVNQNFAGLFEEECLALNAPRVDLEFQGRRGQAERRKAVSRYRPSEVLSEGELKVLAVADFLAECRMTGVKAPIIFDDPVTSLDYLRLNEVAQRISRLADTHQVVVFTHNIFFASTLVSLRTSRKLPFRFYEVRGSEAKKGYLQAGDGPRQDNPKGIGKRINTAIASAKEAENAVLQDALIEHAYGLIRAWCEAFVEQELLANVAQRHRANLMMGGLSKIKLDRFQRAKEALLPLFDRCSRFMAGHSQSIEQLNIKPSLAELERDWRSAQDVRNAYIAQ